MRRILWPALLLALAACGGDAAPDPAEVRAPAEDEAAVLRVRYKHQLYTHCGIAATRFDARDWLADPPINDGQGNPGRGWDNPYDTGVIRLLDEDTAEFTSRAGRVAFFRPRRDDDPPMQPCD